MVASSNGDCVPVPVMIVKNLPNGSPCISAVSDLGNKAHPDDAINECHDLLLYNHKYDHGKINDMFTECLSICRDDGPHVATSKSKLKHCYVSFERNLNFLGECDDEQE